MHADPPALVRRRVVEEQLLSEEEIQMLTQIASGATADIAARNLELSARTLRRRLRLICEKLEVDTPIEAVVWAVRRHLI
ncbi:LuxR C-terminal-related transcriptional regulator [Actinomadura roseirufa]|uniref:LuxR C-terminal-related transcriptional regulator n=1 Tax=Actinomadura roseirufa TaxID=2094049 RepID=UPI001F5EB716|nr:LuxR C-terminal-related transcriptional regulator [Actinomadura roseirufa]